MCANFLIFSKIRALKGNQQEKEDAEDLILFTAIFKSVKFYSVTTTSEDIDLLMLVTDSC